MSPSLSEQAWLLILSGALLFLLGLFQGSAIPFFRNRRMALSGHLAAVQSGMALMIFGLIWPMLVLGAFWSNLACAAMIASMYLVWMGISLAAANGASKALPIAGEGHNAGRGGEVAVRALVGGGAVLGLVSGVLIVVGLVAGAMQ